MEALSIRTGAIVFIQTFLGSLFIVCQFPSCAIFLSYTVQGLSNSYHLGKKRGDNGAFNNIGDWFIRCVATGLVKKSHTSVFHASGRNRGYLAVFCQ